LSVDEIAALPVSDMAERDAHLYIWTINAYLTETYDIARAWGFRPVVLLTWAKAPHGKGLGGTFIQTTEHILFARRGSCAALSRVDTTWWQWKRGDHSAKPEAFMDIVEQVSPAPRLEMFSRRARFGWTTWGDEALHGMELSA
jgi:N6-adenosine-specific RNA methylase IME4